MSAVKDLGKSGRIVEDRNAWFMHCGSGQLHGAGTVIDGGSEVSRPGRVHAGSNVCLRLDHAAGTLDFFVNGAKHGRGHQGVLGTVVPCVSMGSEHTRVVLLPHCDDSADGDGAGRGGQIGAAAAAETS